MKFSTVALFGLSVVISAVAAHHRFHDSAHAMGMLKAGGGSARHPAVLDKERDSHVLIATAGVVPPFRGNARVVLEGGRGLAATFHNAEPVVNFGFHRRPAFRGDTYYDLRPKDRIALWVRITRRKGLPERTSGRSAVSLPAEKIRTTGPVLAFYDTATNDRLLSIPIRFIASGGERHGH